MLQLAYNSNSLQYYMHTHIKTLHKDKGTNIHKFCSIILIYAYGFSYFLFASTSVNDLF